MEQRSLPLFVIGLEEGHQKYSKTQRLADCLKSGHNHSDDLLHLVEHLDSLPCCLLKRIDAVSDSPNPPIAFERGPQTPSRAPVTPLASNIVLRSRMPLLVNTNKSSPCVNQNIPCLLSQRWLPSLSGRRSFNQTSWQPQRLRRLVARV